MYIEIRRNTEISLTKQIYLSIFDHIRSGLLQEELQLPSVRDLSKQLGVSLVTVVKAYQQLEQEGFITSVQGKGTPKRRRQILDIAQSIQSIIIEDDPCSEIYFDKKPPASIKSMDHFGHVIYLKGLSKTLAPGCRIGVLAASGSIFNRLLAAKANTDLGSPLLTQKSILPFINSKRMIDHLKKLRTALRIRRNLVLELLTQNAPSGVSWVIPEGGFNLWISLPSWIDTNHLLLEAKKQQLTFLPGSACYPVEQENHHLRISYSYMNEQLLHQGITTLCNILHSEISSKKVHDGSPYF